MPDKSGKETAEGKTGEDTGTTPPTGGNSGNTSTPDGKQGTTPPAGGNSGDGSGEGKSYSERDIEAAVKNRLERERKKWEADAAERERRAKLDEAERLGLELKDRDDRLGSLERELQSERLMRKISGRVSDPEGALAVAQSSGFIGDDGEFDVDAFLKAKPYFAVEQGKGTGAFGVGNRPAGTTGAPAEIAALEERLGEAKTRHERVALQNQILRLRQKG